MVDYNKTKKEVSELTDCEIDTMIKRLKNEKNQRIVIKLEPRPIEDMAKELPSVVEWLETSLNSIEEDKCESDNFEYFAYETLIELVYGKKYWDWLGNIVSQEKS